MQVQALPQLPVPSHIHGQSHASLSGVSTHSVAIGLHKAPLTSHPLQLISPPIDGEPEVVSIGEALFDLIADQKGLARDEVQSWTPHAGGAPLNVATCLAKLGAKVCFVSAIGKDEAGMELYRLMEESGVDLSGVQLRDEPTRDVYVTRDNSGNRSFAGFGLDTKKYSDCYIDLSKVPMDAVSNAQLLITGTLGLAYPDTRKCMEAAVALAKANDRLVFIDINWRPVFWQCLEEAKEVILNYLASGDIIKISDDDLAWLYPDIDLADALRDPGLVAAKMPNAKCVLMTAGGKGAAFHFRTADKPVTGFVDVFKVNVADTTGAGDAFTAGFTLQLMRQGGLDTLQADPSKLAYAVRFGAACGALTCTKAGAIEAQPSEEEVLDMLEQQ